MYFGFGIVCTLVAVTVVAAIYNYKNYGMLPNEPEFDDCF